MLAMGWENEEGKGGGAYGCERDDEGGVVGTYVDVLVLSHDLLYSRYYRLLVRIYDMRAT